MVEIEKVGMADLKICKAPNALTTLGLGSCVGICLWDTASGIGGLAHIMLPDSKKIKNNSNIYKFADTAIDELIKQMVIKGAPKSRLKAKIAGGAQMFAFQNQNEAMRVGTLNVEAVRKKLMKEGIPIIAQDTGGSHGRTIEFYPQTGKLVIRSIGQPEKTI
ncbi:MAG: chemotaxis protein CheD [Lachnospiraceae bacterium]|nr:chemotaxis protein CheD [Lachnospiraceae bacterium]